MNLWLILITTLPTENATARMRAWRALKATGAATLRDGVYLLPKRPGLDARLGEISADIISSGGQAHLLESSSEDFSALFDRSPDYQQIEQDLADIQAALGQSAPVDLSRALRKLRKKLTGLIEIDFFPNSTQVRTQARLEVLEAEVKSLLSPDEPSASATPVQRLDAADFQGKLWATRRRPWVDRLASAWLIQRHIDRHAQFLWLASPADCPAEALGFDFDGAAFTHVGDLVTFECLLASFGLQQDAALARIARIVHYLDVGGTPAPESSGLETLLDGMCATYTDDDLLLAATNQIFGFIELSYRSGERPDD